jgi:thiamine-phosphate pyrophosphorylase
MPAKIDYLLYLVADQQHCKTMNLVDAVEQAVRAGVTCVQFRDKNINKYDCILLAEKIQAILRPLQIPFIINDHIDIAQYLNADGVHLGQTDMPYTKARAMLGHNKIIGISLENYSQALQYTLVDADYFGVGPVFTTASKPDAAPPIGIQAVQKIRSLLKKPLIAIGGINHTNIEQILRCKVDGIAVISAILQNPEPGLATKHIKQLIQKHQRLYVAH